MAGQQSQTADPYEVDGQAEIAEVTFCANITCYTIPHH
jgi:hypothetical protein